MFPVRDVSAKYNKYAGRSRAKVIDNADPLNRGRIRVDHPQVGKTGWINYLRAPGSFDVPSVGDVVYIEADAGWYDHVVAWGNITTGADVAPNIPVQFQRVYPTNRGIFTPGGHLIEFDDGLAEGEQNASGAKGIRITTTDGNKVDVNDEFSTITISDVGGNSVELSYGENGFIGIQINSAKDVQINAQNQVTVNSQDKTIVNATGDVEIISGGDTKVNASGNCEVTATQIALNGSTGQVLTNVTDPVVDTIFGASTMGVPTVKAG